MALQPIIPLRCCAAFVRMVKPHGGVAGAVRGSFNIVVTVLRASGNGDLASLK